LSRDPWSDLAAELEAAASFARSQGGAIEQRLYEWTRIARIPAAPPPCGVCDGVGCEDCKGTGNAPTLRSEDGQEDRLVSRQLHFYRLTVADLAARLQKFRSFQSVAFPKQAKLEAKHLTAAQVEADGYCGSHWRIGQWVEIPRRATGEPYYRGRCRDCGSWPEGDPPVEALRSWRKGRSPRVAAS
jgi:hypothetical protein